MAKKKALREMRNRSCACGRTVSLSLSPSSLSLFLSFFLSPWTASTSSSPLSLVRPGLLTYRRPDADTVLTSSIPEDDDLQFQTNPLSLSFSPFFFSSFTGLAFASGTQMLALVREERISTFPNCPPLLEHREEPDLLQKLLHGVLFRVLCIRVSLVETNRSGMNVGNHTYYNGLCQENLRRRCCVYSSIHSCFFR